MTVKVLENKSNVLDYIFIEENNQISNWQTNELNNTENRTQKELKENGFIKTISVNDSYDKTTNFINNLYK